MQLPRDTNSRRPILTVSTKDQKSQASSLLILQLDFDTWLLVGLQAELAVKDSNYRIVRRRAVWLLGQWSGVKLSPQLRPKLYEVSLCGTESKDPELISEM